MKNIKLIHTHNKRNLEELQQKIEEHFEIQMIGISYDGEEYIFHCPDDFNEEAGLCDFVCNVTIEKSDEEVIEETKKQDFLNQLEENKDDPDLKVLLQEILNN